MGLKEHFIRKITIQRYEVNLLIIIGMLFILFLYTAWSRFRSDAMSYAWWFYLILLLVMTPFLLKLLKK